MKQLFLGLVLSFMVLGFLTGCGKGYIVSTDKDQHGHMKKVVHTTEALTSWNWFFGSDVTTSYPMSCSPDAIGWKGQLDKEQCVIDHDHLTGPNAGQTRTLHTVHANDTVGKKALAGLWALLFFIPNMIGTNEQTVTQTQTQSQPLTASTIYMGNAPPKK